MAYNTPKQREKTREKEAIRLYPIIIQKMVNSL